MEITCGRKVEKIWWRGDSGRGGEINNLSNTGAKFPQVGNPCLVILKKSLMKIMSLTVILHDSLC